MQLGRELAAALDDTDTLGRWMAHYIAELISRTENAHPGERPALEQSCATEILRLWAHRTDITGSRRPTGSFEPLYRALDRLDPESPRWGFYQIFDEPDTPTSEQTEINVFLKIALGLDESIRDVVRAFVLEAFSIAENREARWLELAGHLQDDRTLIHKTMTELMSRVSKADDSLTDKEKRERAVMESLDQAIETLQTARSALQANE